MKTAEQLIAEGEGMGLRAARGDSETGGYWLRENWPDIRVRLLERDQYHAMLDAMKAEDGSIGPLDR